MSVPIVWALKIALLQRVKHAELKIISGFFCINKLLAFCAESKQGLYLTDLHMSETSYNFCEKLFQIGLARLSAATTKYVSILKVIL